VGTGCLVPQSEETAQVVGMSVAGASRRNGVGRGILEALLNHARARGFRRLILTTSEGWEDAIGFYGACGFRESVRAAGGVLFEMIVRP
jgi:GNAT superfamily N-acetyltransferase